MSRFKISLPGFGIDTNRPSELAVDSQYPSPKVSTLASPPHAGVIFVNWASSGIVVPLGTTKVLHTFPHGLGNVPAVFGTFFFDNGASHTHGTLPLQVGVLGMILLDSDDTNVSLKWFSIDPGSGAVPPFVMQVRFYVLAERGLE